MCPTTAAASSKYMILLSKIATTAVFMINGTINYEYALWVSLWGFIAATVLVYLVNIMLVKRMKRQSIIVWFMAGVIILSGILIPIFAGLDAKDLHEAGGNVWEFKSFC